MPASFSNFSGLCSCSNSTVLADVIMSEMGLRREARYLIRDAAAAPGLHYQAAGQTCLARGACTAFLIDQRRQRCFMNAYFRPSRLFSRVHASEGKHASFVGGARELRGCASTDGCSVNSGSCYTLPSASAAPQDWLRFLPSQRVRKCRNFRWSESA